MNATRLIRKSPYTAEQMYNLVKDIARYPEFVPYCRRARVKELTKRADGMEVMSAELMVVYKMIRQAYTSDVLLNEEALEISVTQARGPFRTLKNEWRFVNTAKGSGEGGDEGSDVHFYLDFEFRTPLLGKMLHPLRTRSIEKFVAVFEARADKIYGTLNPRQ